MGRAISVSRRAGSATAAEAKIARWIGRELRTHPTKARSLVVTVWGDAIAPHGGAVWLSGLIRLLAPLGLNERLVRTNVYRLTQEGWLTARPDGRRSLYRLTASGLRRFEHAYRRIYEPPADRWDGRWELMLVPAAGSPRPERRDLRKELGWEGFGAIAPGVFARPSRNGSQAALPEIVRALGLEARVTVLEASDRPGTRFASLWDVAGDCWDLAALAAEYRAFNKRFGAVLEAFRAGNGIDPERSFVVRSLLIHAFRRVTLHDPRLPPALLPSDWPAPTAYALCRDFYRATHRQAERHLVATLESERGPLPPAAAYFYQRFGGLKAR
jgi:phenylacetic acid degradation operon negative regulatory protein